METELERIAVLETKVDALTDSVNGLKALLEPMVALYHGGKTVAWIAGAVLSYTHWDQILVFIHQLFDPPKH